MTRGLVILYLALAASTPVAAAGARKRRRTGGKNGAVHLHALLTAVEGRHRLGRSGVGHFDGPFPRIIGT